MEDQGIRTFVNRTDGLIKADSYKVNQNLINFLKEIANEKDYINGNIDVQPISTEGANYTSDLFLANISAPQKEDLKLFAKVANISEAMRTANSMFTLIYEREHSFYTELAVAFDKLYNKNNVPAGDRLYIPKYFGYKSTEFQETLVLENLAANGYGSFDRMKTFNWDYASKSVEELAKFHALGLALKEENLEEFERLCKFNDMISNDDMKKVLSEQALRMGTQVIKEEFRARMRFFFDNNNILDGLDKLWTQSDDGFLIHGDYRPNNLMHRRRNGKVEVVPLDYQSFHLGSLAADLMYFVWGGSDAQFRKYYYKHIVEHYYTQLTRALQNLRVDINSVYPRKVFEQELEETKTMGLLIGLAMVSFLTVEPENVQKLDTFDHFNLEPNQLAKERMNGIVEDYVRLGII